MTIHYLALSVNNQHIRYCLYAKRTFEITVWVKNNVVFPSVVVHERLHLVGILCLINADSNEFYSCFLPPFVIDLADGSEFAVARLALCCKERDYKGFAIV